MCYYYYYSLLLKYSKPFMILPDTLNGKTLHPNPKYLVYKCICNALFHNTPEDVVLIISVAINGLPAWHSDLIYARKMTQSLSWCV